MELKTKDSTVDDTAGGRGVPRPYNHQPDPVDDTAGGSGVPRPYNHQPDPVDDMAGGRGVPRPSNHQPDPVDDTVGGRGGPRPYDHQPHPIDDQTSAAGARWPLAWRISARLLLLWPTLLGLLGAALCVWLEEPEFAELLLLSCGSFQAALALVPQDEPALELLLSYPRPAWLLLAERLGLALGLALASTLLYALAAWLRGLEVDLPRMLSALLLFCGLGTLLTLRTRQLTMGGIGVTLIALAAWQGFDAALARWGWLWPLHPLLPAGHEHALANRLAIALLGLACLALALRRTASEPALLGLKGR